MKLNQVTLLTDENISPKVVAYPRNMALDGLDAKEKLWYGTDDEKLITRAYREHRFILTHDSDFGTLAINQGKPCYGILYLRLKNLKSINVIWACECLFRGNIEIHPHTIWVVEDTRIRIRYLMEENKPS